MRHRLAVLAIGAAISRSDVASAALALLIVVSGATAPAIAQDNPTG